MNAPVSPAAPPPASPGPAGPLDEDAALTVDQVSEPPPEVASSLAAPCRDALLQALPCPLCSRFPPGSRPPIPRLRPPPSPPRVLGRPASRIPRSAPPDALTSGVGLPKGELVSLEEGPRPREDSFASSCSERGPRLPLTGRFPDVIEDPLETFFEEVEVDIDRPPPPRPRKPPPTPAPRAAPSPVPSAPPPRATPAPPSATPASPEASDPEPSPSIPVVTSDTPPEASERPTRSRPWLAARSAAASELSPRPPTSSTPAAPRPIAVISDFDEPLPLDPRQAVGIPRSPPPPRPRRQLHPKAVALFGGLFGLAAIGTVLTFAIRFSTPPTKPTAPGRTASSGAVALRTSASASASPEPEPPPDPGPWRVASLANEEGVKMISGKLGTRSLMTALEEEHVPKPQIFRILKAFDDPKLFDKPKKSHQFLVALDRPSKRVRGFEYQASATEVWQAREVEEGRLAGAKLDLKIEQRRVTRGVVVDSSLKASLVEAGLDDDMVGLLDDALSDRVTLDRLGKGTRLRIVAQEQLVAGRFSRYLSLDAVEYQLPRSDKPTRLYHFRNGKMSGVYDAAGKAPYRTSWGPPLKVVRITSKFNPKRLHPVLHTVMPHNGTDFGAAMGTPVYAVAAGTVSHVGPHGPSGNLVLIEHPNGLESGYAHLSRFAQGLKKGDKVETQQLVGYVGSTGRSTGPHLHFSIKKAGVYIDAMTVLKLNQERVLPKSEREAFEAFRKEMDQLLDAIPLADVPPGEGPADPDENEHRDDNNHGEEHEEEAAPAASGNAPPTPSGPEPPPAPPVTDDTTPESAVWRPD